MVTDFETSTRDLSVAICSTKDLTAEAAFTALSKTVTVCFEQHQCIVMYLLGCHQAGRMYAEQVCFGLQVAKVVKKMVLASVVPANGPAHLTLILATA